MVELQLLSAPSARSRDLGELQLPLLELAAARRATSLSPTGSRRYGSATSTTQAGGEQRSEEQRESHGRAGASASP